MASFVAPDAGPSGSNHFSQASGTPTDPARVHQAHAAARAQPEPARDQLGWPAPFAPSMPPACAATVLQLRAPLQQDRLDTFHLNEICVCCQGTALDLDELLGLMMTLMGKGGSFAIELGLRGVAALPGAYYGSQNYRGGVATGRALGELSAAVEQDRRVVHALRSKPEFQSLSAAAPPPDLGPVLGAARATTALLGAQPHGPAQLASVVRERDANLTAQRRAIDLSRSLQRFIEVFDGSVPMISAALTVAATFAPTLGIVAGALLVVYCFAHAIRYGLWDLRETLAETRVGGTTQHPSRWRDIGEDAVDKQKNYRVAILSATILSFVGYGVAAAGVVAATLGVGGASFASASLYALMVTMAAVLVLNNGPVKDIYGKNSKDRLSRYDLGSEAQIVSLMGRGATELNALAALERASRSWPHGTVNKVQAFARELGVAGLVALGYVTATVGLTGIFAGGGHDHHAFGHDHVGPTEHSHEAHDAHHATDTANLDERGGHHHHHTRPPERSRMFGIAELGDAFKEGSLALEGWMARTLHGLRADAVRTSPTRHAALRLAVDALEEVMRQPDGTLPYAVPEPNAFVSRMMGLLEHLKLADRVRAGTAGLADSTVECETAAIMALVHERRPELRFALGALSDHLHARRRIAAGASIA